MTTGLPYHMFQQTLTKFFHVKLGFFKADRFELRFTAPLYQCLTTVISPLKYNAFCGSPQMKGANKYMVKLKMDGKVRTHVHIHDSTLKILILFF